MGVFDFLVGKTRRKARKLKTLDVCLRRLISCRFGESPGDTRYELKVAAKLLEKDPEHRKLCLIIQRGANPHVSHDNTLPALLEQIIPQLKAISQKMRHELGEHAPRSPSKVGSTRTNR